MLPNTKTGILLHSSSNPFHKRFWKKLAVLTHSEVYKQISFYFTSDHQSFQCTRTMYCSECTYLYHAVRFLILRGGADKSLARPTSRCRMTESTVSLERGVCLCAELKVFSCYRGWKEACQVTRAISTTSRRELSSSFLFPARQGAEGNSRHSDRNIRGICNIVRHRQKLGGPV